MSWKSFSWRALLLGADQSSTGSVVSLIDLRPTEKTITTTAATKRTLNGDQRVVQNQERLSENIFLVRICGALYRCFTDSFECAYREGIRGHKGSPTLEL